MSELNQKLAELEKLQAEIKAQRAAEKEFQKRRTEALKEARRIMRAAKLTATDFT